MAARRLALLCLFAWLAGAAGPAVLGTVDAVDADGNVLGWALDPAAPSRPVALELRVDDAPTGAVAGRTGTPRPDVAAKLRPAHPGLTADAGFRLPLPDTLRDGVRRRAFVYARPDGGPPVLLNPGGTPFRFPQPLAAERQLPRALTGWIDRITPDGTIVGWAMDGTRPDTPIEVKFYADAASRAGGRLAGTATAKLLWEGLGLTYGLDQPRGDAHAFAFVIPETWRDGRPHQWFVEAEDGKGAVLVLGGPTPGKPPGPTATLQPRRAATVFRTDHRCERADCPSVTPDYDSDAHPARPGWAADDVDYFRKWRCTSPTGLDIIARLNVMPHERRAPTVWMDSFYVNFRRISDGYPAVFFTAGRKDGATLFSLKQAVYSAARQRWQVLDILDSPLQRGGVSSMDGLDAPASYIMNDYSLPGWGPTANLPGSQGRIPGVAETSANPEIGSYPLTGEGPLGLTAIRSLVQTKGWGGLRSCVHMNPKLFDYGRDGKPRAMTAYLAYQDKPNVPFDQPCALPRGAPISELPGIGNYVYRYAGPALGWQLDLRTGLIEKVVRETNTNAYKLMRGSNTEFLRADWDFRIKVVDFAKPAAERRPRLILDCSARDAAGKPLVTGGEPTGSESEVYFGANDGNNGYDATGRPVGDLFVAYRGQRR